MSNEALRTQLANLQEELREVERENAAIEDDIERMGVGIVAGTSLIAEHARAINESLDNNLRLLEESHNYLVESQNEQGQIRFLFDRLKAMELANKTIRRCQNMKYYDFAVYRRVRKIVAGLMDNLDMNMVKPQVIEKAVDRAQLEEPDFWLTCVLIAVSAWFEDDKEQAHRALKQAISLNLKRTASFLMIFNLRMQRDDAAMSWFRELSNCQLTGAERNVMLLFFSLLSKTIKENVDEDTRHRLLTFIDETTKHSMAYYHQTDESVTASVQQCLVNMTPTTAFPTDCALIPQCCSMADQWKQAYALAANNETILALYTQLRDVSTTARNEYLKQYIDEVVELPGEKEAEVYDIITFNEEIIRYKGDRVSAKESYDKIKMHELAPIDVMGEMLRWLFLPSTYDETNPQMRLSMLNLIKDYHRDAYDRYVLAYTKLFTSVTDVNLGEFTVHADLTAPQPAKDELKKAYDEKAENLCKGVKDIPAYIVFGVAAVSIALIMVAGPFALILTGVLAAVGGVLMFMNSRKRTAYRQSCESDCGTASSLLDSVCADYARLADAFADKNLLCNQIRNLLGRL